MSGNRVHSRLRKLEPARRRPVLVLTGHEQEGLMFEQ